MRRTSEYILAWLLWAITSIIGFFVAYMTHTAVVTTTRFVATTVAGNDPHRLFQAKYTGDTVYQFGLVIIAILLLILLVATEPYYHAGVDRGDLARRFALLSTIEFGVLFVALALQVVITGVLGLFTFSGLLITLGVLALTVLGSWVVLRLPKGSDVPPAPQ